MLDEVTDDVDVVRSPGFLRHHFRQPRCRANDAVGYPDHRQKARPQSLIFGDPFRIVKVVVAQIKNDGSAALFGLPAKVEILEMCAFGKKKRRIKMAGSPLKQGHHVAALTQTDKWPQRAIAHAGDLLVISYRKPADHSAAAGGSS